MLDFELLKKELEEAQRQKYSDFWTPEYGENLIRILPPRDGKLFYRKVGVHYRLAGSGMEFCPKVCFDKSCPICETVQDLRKIGSSGAMELVKRLGVIERFMMNVIPLTSSEKTIKQYLAPRTVRLELLKIILDPDYGDITDLETGRNVVIEKIQGNVGYVNYIVRAKPSQVALSQLLGRKFSVEEIPYFDEIIAGRMKSYDELKGVLFGGEEVGLDELVERYIEENVGQSGKEVREGNGDGEVDGRKEAVGARREGEIDFDVEDIVRTALSLLKQK